MTLLVGVLAVGLAAMAVAVLMAPATRPTLGPGRPRQGSRRQSGAALADPRTARAVSGLAGAALAVVLGGLAGVGAGAIVAIGAPRAISRMGTAGTQAAARQLAADLPLALDLLAACLSGGAPLPRAAAAVAEALPGPVGARLDRVAAALAVGSPPEEAWAALTIGSRPDDPLAPVARALVRAARGGAPVVETVSRLAQETRAVGRARGEQAARRAGVLAVAPLGLCFLPAFVLLGVVPLVAGLVGPMLASF